MASFRERWVEANRALVRSVTRNAGIFLGFSFAYFAMLVGVLTYSAEVIPPSVGLPLGIVLLSFSIVATAAGLTIQRQRNLSQVEEQVQTARERLVSLEDQLRSSSGVLSREELEQWVQRTAPAGASDEQLRARVSALEATVARRDGEIARARAALAEAELRTEFLEYEQASKAAASWWMAGAVLVVVATSVAAGWLLIDAPDGGLSLAEVFRRLAITVPGAILFGLMARQGENRQRHADWAALNSVQLRSLEGFLATIDGGDEVKDEVRLQLAKAVFTGGAVAFDTKRSAKSAAATPLADLEALLKLSTGVVAQGTAEAGRTKAQAEANKARAEAFQAWQEARKAEAGANDEGDDDESGSAGSPGPAPTPV